MYRALGKHVGELTLAAIIGVAGCTNGGPIGSIASGSLAVPGTNTATGTVQYVDTHDHLITIRQKNGEPMTFSYDNSTIVSYNKQNYPLATLQYGDEVAVPLQVIGNSSYYGPVVQVVQRGNATGPYWASAVQELQGTVRYVNQTNGWFTVDANGRMVTVTMPYNPARRDRGMFGGLRTGQTVDLYGVFINDSHVQLRHFD